MKKFGARFLFAFGVALALSGLVFAIPFLLGCYLCDRASQILGGSTGWVKYEDPKLHDWTLSPEYLENTKNGGDGK